MKKVVVYSQDNCVFCQELKEMLGQSMVNYIEKDIELHKEDWDIVSESTGVSYVPTVLLVDSETESGRLLAPDRDFDEVSECLQHILTDLNE
tara:strand:+ start:207 stop:482 length:276 start_codon:yes stop_codon:yes gene_type:complete